MLAGKNRLNNRPTTTPIKYSENIISKFCLMLFLFLNKMISPIPAPEHNPPMQEAKEIMPSI